MTRFVVLAVLSVILSANTSYAEDHNHIPMLAHGKTWYYIYHHFDDTESGSRQETQYYVLYRLMGDTVINDQQYMKMYRIIRDDSRYYGAFREDEKGRVWQYDYLGDQKDFMLCDYTCNSYPGDMVMASHDVINVRNLLLHRYLWCGYIGVEGVGIEGKGLIHYIYEPEPDCICDYETFDFVSGAGMSFYNNEFRDPHYIDLTPDEKELVENNNNFAFNIFRKTRTEASQVISPLSITYALSMQNNGAAGSTQQEICDVLGFGDVDAQNAFCLRICNDLNKAGYIDDTKVGISNTIFVNQALGWQLQSEFKHKVATYYYAYPEERDFGDGMTMDVINQWASSHTNGMVDHVLSEEEFNPHAVSYLLNATYFKGVWSNPFKVEDTKEEPFNSGDLVPMMHKEWEDMMYYEDDLYQTVWLPYGNKTYQMQVILPREGKTLDDVVAHLNGENWQVQGRSTQVDLKLPRIETTSDIDLKNAMSELGMPSAFNPSDADFSKLCVDNQGQSIYIELMKQVAKIKVDEGGTEAAAVTVSGNDATSVPERASFHANRPFLYIISEKSAGIILFIGQFTGGVSASISMPKLSNANDQTIYNLAGQRLSNPPAHGIYIQNGKKHVVK